MNKFPFLLLLLFIAFGTFSQHEQITDHWKTCRIHDDSLGTIDYHVYKNNLDEYKPLIIYLEGSGNFPLYWLNPNGKYSTSTTLNFKEISKDYHIILISKPDIPFVDSIRIAPSGRKYYPMNENYRQNYSLYWRVGAADRVIEEAIKNLKVDMHQIVVWGHSEGAQVAPAVAVKNARVTHVISMMGNALNQFYDFIMQERLAAQQGEISNEEAQLHIDSLYAEYEKIYQDPKSTTKEWYGETYYKWSSFTLTSPLENMLKLNIPILYIAGGADQNQNIINMDYAKLEFMRKGKTNLTYLVFPACDHYFLETRIESSGKKEWVDHLEEVNKTALNWINKTNKP